MEICLMTEALAEKINNRAPMADIKAQALRDGWFRCASMDSHKAIQGVTTLEEVMTVTAASD